MSTAEKRLTVDEHVSRAVDALPSWDDLPIESRSTLLRIFRNVELPALGEVSA